jgi:hypothetical protein
MNREWDKGRSVRAAGYVVAFLITVALAGCAASEGGESGWTPLFNGRDLTGWTVKATPADRDKGFWRVEEGAIVADSLGHKGHDYVWLVSDREYADFTLRLRFQAFRDSPGNSGVQVRSRYDDQAGWLDGPQIDINPPGPWRTGMIWDETRQVNRWLYPAVPKGQWVDPSMARPDLVFHYADESPGWNVLEIAAVGTRITVSLNGLIVTNYDGAGILDDDVHRKRQVGMKGHIALQIHKGDQLRIRFKDLALREHPSPSALMSLDEQDR